jgi:hypothetical protein
MKPQRAFHGVPVALARPRTAWRSVAAPVPVVDDAASRLEAERRAQLMTMPELARYLRYLREEITDPATIRRGANAAYNFVRKHGIRIMKRGTSTLVRVGDVDRYLETGSNDRNRAVGKR